MIKESGAKVRSMPVAQFSTLVFVNHAIHASSSASMISKQPWDRASVSLLGLPTRTQNAGYPNLRNLLSGKAVFLLKFDKFPFEIHAYSPMTWFSMRIPSMPRHIQVSTSTNPPTALWAVKNLAERMCVYISSLSRCLAHGSPWHSWMNDSTVRLFILLH